MIVKDLGVEGHEGALGHFQDLDGEGETDDGDGEEASEEEVGAAC